MGRARDWCILRTAGPRTLPLAASLAAAALDVWTPRQVITRRRGRLREKVEIDTPMMPTFVFARARHLSSLATIIGMPISPHPPFSLFRFDGRIPLVADRDIAHVREVEERAAWVAAKKQPAPFTAGQDVRVAEGAASGLSGIVETCDGQFALIAFGGNFRMKIATFLLRTDEVHDVQMAA